MSTDAEKSRRSVPTDLRHRVAPSSRRKYSPFVFRRLLATHRSQQQLDVLPTIPCRTKLANCGRSVAEFRRCDRFAFLWQLHDQHDRAMNQATLSTQQ